jgi:polyhydroxybutyrate depolymerase
MKAGVAGLASIVAFLAWPGAHAAAPAPHTIDVAGQARDYLLVTPDHMPRGARPLVLVLHGHLGTAANALGKGRAPSPLSAWLDIAERESVLVAALQGLEGADRRTGWHDCRADAADNPRTDDVAFASALVQQLVGTGRADARRIYVMGMSNGAMMTLRLALEMRPAPAAVAAVAGTLAQRSDCAATPQPVSVLLIHGTDDPLVPYRGGGVGFGQRRDRGQVLSVDATRDFWLHVDGLDKSPRVRSSFPHRGEDATRASKVTYGPDGGPQVEVVTIEGGGHVEPSLRFHYGALYSRIVGMQSRDVEAAEEAWTFFRDKQADAGRGTK